VHNGDRVARLTVQEVEARPGSVTFDAVGWETA
jgi:hypothetical protein